jgi:hypothetical protein
MDIREIVQNAGMSDRPAFYSGRGATLSDLNSTILQKIHDGIVKEFGKEAGEGFVQMVDELRVMSATSFLNSVYRLSHNNWVFSPELVSTSSVDIDSEGSAWGTLLGAMSRGDRDDSLDIKSKFLSNNGVKMKRQSGYVKDRYGAVRYYN